MLLFILRSLLVECGHFVLSSCIGGRTRDSNLGIAPSFLLNKRNCLIPLIRGTRKRMPDKNERSKYGALVFQGVCQGKVSCFSSGVKCMTGRSVWVGVRPGVYRNDVYHLGGCNCIS